MKYNAIAIDPGKSGGIAYYNFESQKVDAFPMPEGMTGVCDAIRKLSASCDLAIVENVGKYQPGNSGPAAVTFAEHCGVIKAALYCNGVAIVDRPTPQKWMKALGHGVSRYLPESYKTMPDKDRAKARAEAKRLNKNAIKEDMQQRYPALNVTLKTADALGMLRWAVHNSGENSQKRP